MDKKRLSIILIVLLIVISGAGKVVFGFEYQSQICYSTTKSESHYADTVFLFEGSVLVFEKYSNEYKSFQYPSIINRGKVYTIYATQEEESDSYFSDIVPSYSKKYVYIGRYYTTLEPIDFETEVLKFGEGLILNSSTGQIVCRLYGMDTAGSWTKSDQWFTSDGIVFNPPDEVFNE